MKLSLWSGAALCLLSGITIIDSAQANVVNEVAQMETGTGAMPTSDMRGRIISISGNLIEVQPAGGEETVWIGVSRETSIGLVEGMDVFLAQANGRYKIVGIASSSMAVTQQSSGFSSRTAALWQEFEQNFSRRRSSAVNIQQRRTRVQPTVQQSNTIVLPRPSNPQPIRALW